MDDQTHSGHTKFSTAGGLLTIIFVNLTSEDLLRTVILAAIGATVSFGVSYLWKVVLRRWKG